jgi:acyl-coenzyme A synthetase/AMP-(fatty) acid ligase
LYSLRGTADEPLVLAQLDVPEPPPEAPAAVVFTSGATGPAKGVRYTHGQLCAQRDALRALYGITPADRFVAAFAPFAVFGPALGMVTGLADMDVTAPATLTAAALDDACRRIGATMVFASPAALANVVRTATGPAEALAAVRLVMSAGAPVPIATLRAVQGLCPGAELRTPYGMTEVLPVADVSLRDRESAGTGRGVCVGHPVAGAVVRIAAVDRSSGLDALNPGISGDVLVCAPWMSDGYDRLWHTEQVARPVERLGTELRTWHRTGDVGHVDEQGRLWIEGRVQHLIHTSSGTVTPVPLEIAAESVAGVVRAGAVGVGPAGVQQVVLVLEIADGTLRRGGGPAPAALAAEVRAAVSPQAVAAVWVTERLPVDIRHNAKIDRTALGRQMERVLSGESR